MLHDQHIIVSQGRAEGGDFVMITHEPTGISRSFGPPLGVGKERDDRQKQILQEIESELRDKGLTEYIWHPKKKSKNR